MTDNQLIGLRIKERRESLGMRQEDLGKILFLNKSTIQRYETGQVQKIKIPVIHAMAKALDLNPDYLALRTDDPGKFREHPEWYGVKNGNYSLDDNLLPTPHAKRIPVLGSVPAGIPIEAVEDIIDYEEISEEMARDGEYFALRIKGTSMEPKFSEGDVVVIRKQETVENGEIAVVLIDGDEATIKKFFRTDAGIMLVGLNPSFSPLTYTPEQAEQLPVRVIGRVVELRAKF